MLRMRVGHDFRASPVQCLPSMIPVEVGEILAGKYPHRPRDRRGRHGRRRCRRARATAAASGDQVRASGRARKAARGSSAFLREARAVVRLRSEHVARVIDVGALPETAPTLHGDGVPARLDAGRAGPTRILGCLSADVVHYNHPGLRSACRSAFVGIVHRDLKPENIFLTHSVSGAPLVKVLDFGVSKMESQGGNPRLNGRTAALVGSPLLQWQPDADGARRCAATGFAFRTIWALGRRALRSADPRAALRRGVDAGAVLEGDARAALSAARGGGPRSRRRSRPSSCDASTRTPPGDTQTRPSSPSLSRLSRRPRPAGRWSACSSLRPASSPPPSSANRATGHPCGPALRLAREHTAHDDTGRCEARAQASLRRSQRPSPRRRSWSGHGPAHRCVTRAGT